MDNSDHQPISEMSLYSNKFLHKEDKLMSIVLA